MKNKLVCLILPFLGLLSLWSISNELPFYKNEDNGNNISGYKAKAFAKETANLKLLKKLTQDSSDCLDFIGEGPGCGKIKVCPDHYLYQSTKLLKHINSNLAETSKKIPATCCRDFDTLSLKKQIFLIELCWGGTYTETWLYMQNEQGKFTSKEYGYQGIRLEKKTNEVNDFLIHDYHKDTGIIFRFNGQTFDPFKKVTCQELNEPQWKCWEN